MLATTEVFLGPNATRQVTATLRGKRVLRTAQLGGLGASAPTTPTVTGSATKYGTTTPPPGSKTVDEESCARGGPYASLKLGAQFVGELEQTMMRYGMMQGNADPWVLKLASDGLPSANDAAWPWLMKMAFADSKQVYDIWLPRFKIDKAYFKECQELINRLAVARRGTPAGIIGSILSKTLVPVAKTVEENPALLFAAPLAVWGISTLVTGGAAAGGAAASSAPAATAATAVPATATITPTVLTAATPIVTGAGITTAGALTTAATTASAVGAGAKILDAVETAGVIDKAKEIAPKIIEGVNTARTVAAVANGEVPPPPIDIGDGSLADWAAAIGEQYVAGQISETERAMLQAEVQRLQTEVASQAQSGVPYYPSSQVPVVVQGAMADKKEGNETLNLLLLAAIPLVAILAQK